MQFQITKGKKKCTLINDNYKYDISSLLKSIEMLQQQNQNKIKTIILSDIEQDEKNKEKLYKDIYKTINKSDIAKIIGIGENIGKYLQNINKEKYFFNSITEFLQSKVIENFNNEAILIKTSIDFEPGKIVSLLQEKNHRTTLEINLRALTYNLNYFRSFLKEETKIMIMVKAFSYGSGNNEIARYLQYQKIDYLGVAYTDEGVELRKAKITMPIMVMNPDSENFGNIIKYNLEPEIYDLESLVLFNKLALENNKSEYSIHIKIDTGMKRLGFEMQDIEKLLIAINQSKAVKIKSVLSHLVGTDEEEHDEFTEKQISDFQFIANKIEKYINYKFDCHVLNSGGIERFADAQFDMVRLGIGFYGISRINEKNTRNISTLKTKISQIKTIKANETIGYSRKGKVAKETKIAVLPIGYADGLNRKLSNGLGQVLIGNKKANIIGNICMDMCMVDLTGIEAKENDEVIIFGENLSISDMAKKLETIPYEILTSISQRVKRIYVQ